MGKHTQNNTEEMIQQTFIKLYSTTEVHHITVRGICAEMGISRTTFYRYYDDTYAILEAIGDSVIDQLMAAKRDFSSRQFLDSTQYIRQLIGCIKKNEQFVRRAMADGNSYFVSKWRAVIKEDLKEKYKREYSAKMEHQLSLEMMCGASLGVFTYWLSHMDELTDDMVVDRLIKLWELNKFFC